jgi:proton-dependent oligopeptide transporter, POT family
MSGLAAFWQMARTGFTRTFWVANVIELFERLAYYGSKAILTVYIAEQVGLGPGKAGFLVGSLFNTLLYFLPPLAGTVVDRYGFKKSLLTCFSIFSIGYFLVGLGGLPQGKPLVDALGASTYMIAALVITAIGGSLIKPCIVGTVARTTTSETKSLGYSIYYTLVNFGGAIGPLLALQVRENIGIAYVLVMSSLVSLALVVGTLVFYKEPPRPADAAPPKSMAGVLADMAKVFTNLKFVSFLVIFSGFWIMFWQIFYSLPFYVKDVLHFGQFELIETVDAWTIILVTIPITALAKRMKSLAAMTLGFAIASASWFLMGSSPTLAFTIVAIALFAIGEGLQSPRYYEYVADLAPKEQVGTYMGFAFLPIALGTFVAGWIAGPLVERYVGVTGADKVFVPGPEFAQAGRMWYWVGGIGIVSTLAMLAYDRLVVKRAR